MVRWTIVVALLAVPVSIARADEDVEAALAAYEQAEFAAAREAMRRAEAGDGLTRDDVVELLRVSALVNFASGDRAAMRRDLAHLLALEPGLDPTDFPPSIQTLVRDELAPAAVPVALSGQLSGGRFEVHPTAPARLLRELRVSCRVDTGGWVVGTRPVLEVEARAGQRVQCHASIIGPGGATLATAGSPGAPISAVIGGAPSPAEVARAVPEPAERPRPEGGRALPWVLAAVGAVVVAVALALALTLSDGASDQTVVAPPALP